MLKTLYMVRTIGYVEEDGDIREPYTLALKKSLQAAKKFCTQNWHKVEPADLEIVEVWDDAMGGYDMPEEPVTHTVKSPSNVCPVCCNDSCPLTLAYILKKEEKVPVKSTSHARNSN